MATIAVIGPDGAGKTTITRMLERSKVLRLKYLYMGINTSSSNIALPTSRLAEYLKLQRDQRPEARAAGAVVSGHTEQKSPKQRGLVWVSARLLNRLAEQWFRQAVAWSYQLRGFTVLYDRHFVFDFGGGSADDQHVPWDKRVYRWCLAHLYPRPDLVVMLDAPGAVLFARKGESTPEELEKRRQLLRRQGAALPAFIEVDATRPLDVVYADVVHHIVTFCRNPRDADG